MRKFACLIGSKGVQFFRRIGNAKTLATVTHLGDRPHVADLIGTIKVMLDLYEGRQARPRVPGAQRVRQHDEPEAQPAPAAAGRRGRTTDELQKHVGLHLRASAAELLDGVLMRYIESQVYQGAVENVGCEMAAHAWSR